MNLGMRTEVLPFVPRHECANEIHGLVKETLIYQDLRTSVRNLVRYKVVFCDEIYFKINLYEKSPFFVSFCFSLAICASYLFRNNV